MAVRIKICGITRYEDAKVAANLGVDAVGFIFYEKSARYIPPAKAAQIIKRLPPFISRVGVFVDQDPANVVEIARTTGIDTIQLHGNERPDYCRKIPFPVIKAFSVTPESDLSILQEYDVAGFLLDTWHPSLRGGTGMTFDWSVARKACGLHPHVLLAGGLGPSNLLEALDAVGPYGVDINSGVEIKPGVKNPHKMRDAVGIAKKWGSGT
jgi:phosphoribosylanthranilate isomerase